ncbi:MAG: HAD family hydrolase [Acutalibacteraceae bacterium]|nr:HAD family hydrolase [Acutalibacteraceae bacterium]
MIKAILFDLDGTLLPMDQDKFANTYFSGLAKKALPYGYESDKLIKTIWEGTYAMVKNNSENSNETVFWNLFADKYGVNALKDKVIFDEFYENEFKSVKRVCGYNEKAKECVDTAKKSGFRVVLATNPIFPETATEERISWTGLNSCDFELYTTYENSCRCKPNPEYYKEILDKINLQASECLMVGNDVDEDMIAETLGIKVFLLTDCLINKHNKDISVYDNGNFDDLIKFISELNK